jgi:hypothetical protein
MLLVLLQTVKSGSPYKRVEELRDGNKHTQQKDSNVMSPVDSRVRCLC